MLTSRKTILLSLLALGLVLLCAGGTGYILLTSPSAPTSLVTSFPWSYLTAEASTMKECAECHEGAELHTCYACHDEHGAIELAGVPFYAYLELIGDVPEPGYIQLAEILPYPEIPNTHVSLLSFLDSRGVNDFESITLVSGDGGFVTIERDALNERALLMPYQDGIRFASEDLHVSTWLKGLRRMIVIGKETPLRIAGEATSFGRLLQGPTRAVTVEPAAVMLVSEVDGKVRKAQTASRMEGVPLAELLSANSYEKVTVQAQDGKAHELSREDALEAILVPVQGQLTLVLPERGRAQWIEGVQAIDIE